MIALINDEPLGQPISLRGVNVGLSLAKLLEAAAILNANEPPTMFGPFTAPDSSVDD
jgi:hypothetical protein